MDTVWVVAYVIHVSAPYQYIPKLIITNVPDGVKITPGLLERAGFQYGDMGKPWANHRILRVGPDTPSNLIARLRAGEGRRISYEELVRRVNQPLFPEGEQG